MTSLPPTQATLLVRIRNPFDHEAWSRFVDLYAPLVYGFLRKRQLQDADAADLTQDVFRQVAASIESLEYDAKRGSFRGWLLTIVQHRLTTHWRRNHYREQAAGDSAALEQLQQIPQPQTLDDSLTGTPTTNVGCSAMPPILSDRTSCLRPGRHSGRRPSMVALVKMWPRNWD